MSPNLDDELKIPPEATLEPSFQTWSLQTKGGTTSASSITLATDTAIRPNPRCLVVGRQAKAADIRIQHGSISRRHAALYFLGPELILQDFGSKKGTTVNGNLIQGTTQKLQEGDEIIFGHVRESVFQIHCSSSILSGKDDAKDDKDDIAEDDDKQNTTLEGPKDAEEQPSPQQPAPVEPGAGLTGRAKREAEIAAMMNSLEDDPSYSKYVPSKEDLAPRNKAKGSNKSDKRSNGRSQASAPATADAVAMDNVTKTAQQHRLPILERITMDPDSERRHMVTCIGLDPSGVRFVVGNTDNTLRFYDFGGMDRVQHDPFKMISAEDEGHVVADVCYSNTGDRLIVGTGSLQPFVLDRDGGEMYVLLRRFRARLNLTPNSRLNVRIKQSCFAHEFSLLLLLLTWRFQNQVCPWRYVCTRSNSYHWSYRRSNGSSLAST